MRDHRDGVPGGAGVDAHIRYTSNSKFGAVLMTTAPVSLRAYNDEAVFASWLSRNKARLYKRYGPELKKYGMWIVTRTYTTGKASINAWMDKDKASVVSLKAKAAMLGELGEDLDWKDKALDKDWSHYKATTEHGLVVFMDGIEVGPADWFLEGIRQQLATSNSPRERRLSEYVPDPIRHQPSVPIHQLDPPKSVLKKTRGPSLMDETSSRRGSRLAGAGPRSRSESDARRLSRDPDSEVNQTSSHAHDDLTNENDPSQHHTPSAQDGQPHALTADGSHARPVNTDQALQASAPGDITELSPQPPRIHHEDPPPPQAQDDGRRKSSLSYSNIFHRRISQSSPRTSPDHRDISPSSPFHRRPREQVASLSLPPIRRIRNFSGDDTRPTTLVADEDILEDAGLSSLSRSQSLRKASVSSSVRTSSMTRSLRRETRSIHEERDVEEVQTATDDKAFEFFSKDMDEEEKELMPHELGLPDDLKI